MHVVCLICTDEIDTDASVCKCGHMFHSECLKHWLKMNKTCPQCRTLCSTRNDVIKLFISGPDDTPGPGLDGTMCASPGKLKSDIAQYKKDALEKEAELSILKEEFSFLKEDNHSLRSENKKIEKNLHSEKATCSQLRKEVKDAHQQLERTKDLKEQLDYLREQNKVYKSIQNTLDEGSLEIKDLINSYGNTESSIKQLTQCLFHLQKSYDQLKTKKNEILGEKESLVLQLSQMTKKASQQKIKIHTLKSDLQLMNSENESKTNKLDLLLQTIDSPATQKHLLRLIIESPMPEKLVEFQTKRAKTNFETDKEPNEDLCQLTPYNSKQIVRQLATTATVSTHSDVNTKLLGESTNQMSGLYTAIRPCYNLLPTNSTSTNINTHLFPENKCDPLNSELRDEGRKDLRLPMGQKGLRISNLGLKPVNMCKRGFDGVGGSSISSISIQKPRNSIHFGKQDKNIFAKRKTILNKKMNSPNTRLSTLKSYMKKAPKYSLRIEDEDYDDDDCIKLDETAN